jgi:hypothetical protein
MNTNDLIDSLAKGLAPVTPLWRPGKRAAAWVFAAAVYIAALAVGVSMRAPNAASADAAFWLTQIVAAATGVLACRAACASVVPGASIRAGAWAVLAGGFWLLTLVTARSQDVDWSQVPAASHEWLCVGFIVIGGAPLMLALTWMLRRGAPLRPGMTAAFAALAVGALANIGACVSLPHANGAITLAWHGGVVLTLVALAALSGRLVFAWNIARSTVLEDASRRER